MRRGRLISGLIVISCAAWLAIVQGAAPAPAFVERFTPTGAAKQVRQVSVRFRAPMVALGDPTLPEPFDVACAAAGTGRWVDARNWVYDFEQDADAGLTCTFTLRPSLRALDGTAPDTATLQRRFTFTTGGPAIVGSHPYEGWTQTDERQIFLLKLDAPADPASVREHARCIVEGIGEQIPLEVIEGEERAAVLRERQSLGYWYYRLLWKSGAESRLRVRDQSLDTAERKILLARCQRPLPPGAKVELLWGRGITTQSGVATAEDQRLAFRVRPEFAAQTQCTRINAQAGCLPMLPITLRFTAPVPREQAAKVRLKLANGKVVAPRVEGEQPTVESVDFAPPFAELKPVQVLLPDGFVDDAGRPLANAQRFPLEVRVDAFPPLAKFSSSFGILEAEEGGVLPVTLRAIEPRVLTRQVEMPARFVRLDGDPARIAEWMRRVAEAGEPRGEFIERSGDETDGDDEDDAGGQWREDTGSRSVFGASDAPREMTLPKPGDARATQVIGIPLKAPGFYVVEIESRILGRALLGRDESRYVATSALVTNIAVHFKWGRESSLAWVTRLSDGMPVSDAEVVIANACTGAELWRGASGADGIARVPRSFGIPHENSGCSYAPRQPLMVLARKADDFSFTQTAWNQGIAPEDFNLRREWSETTARNHTVLDRALFRAGETVSMKHFFRHPTMDGLEIPANVAGDRALIVRHEGSGQEYPLTTRVGADGIGESTWAVPVEARLGDYVVTLKDPSGTREPLARFKVEQFRLPSMRAAISGSPTPLVRPRDASLDVHVAYLAGGGASGLPVRVRTLVQPAPVRFADYDDFVFGGREVMEGVVPEGDGAIDFEADAQDGEASTARVTAVTLDAAGGARVTVPELPEIASPSQLIAEVEYEDANGERLTTGTRVALVPARLHVGVRREGWAGSATQLRFRVVVLDLSGKPVAGKPVEATLYGARRYSFRKRLIGGFYAYETTRETRRLDARCDGTTDAQGLLTCEVAPKFAGEVLIRAEAKDDEGRTAGATTSAWIYDDQEAWFGGTAGDRMDLLPERKSYEAGETARFQVRMPFRKAQGLVTVEREGVVDGFVTTLDARSPVVDVPIADRYAPNVFVSVLAVRGRVARADVPPGTKRRVPRREEITGLVDLNKPAYRLGMAEIKVGWKPHRLDVRVTPDRPVYRVRDRARVHVHVSRADGGALPAGTEVAFAAVDAALLGLAPNPSWDVLTRMMGERAIEVLSATAQMQVVGKRHYGRKAVPSGGGGGRDVTRELFDTLLLWRGRVRVDAAGDAMLDVPLNDSLTEFRLVAVASGGAGHFGTGSAAITATQDVILVSGLPPLAREGDALVATVTVRNTTQGTLDLDVAGTRTALDIDGKAVAGARPAVLEAQRVTLAAGQSRDVSWPVTIPAQVASLRYEVRARPAGAPADAPGDALRVAQQVVSATPVRTVQATLQQVEGSAAIAVARPAAALPGRGGLEVTLRARLGDGLDGVREFMRLYPYDCIEQLFSTAVVSGDAARWAGVMQRLPAYLDRDGLLRYFPTDAVPGEDALTAYVLAASHEAGMTLPDGVRDRMLAALRGFVDGRIVRRSALPTADLAIRKIAAIEALARYEQANASMLSSIAIEPQLWPTSAVLDWLSVLRRMPQVPRAAARLDEAQQILRTRLTLSGSTMTFSTERTDGLWWLMISGDSNANRLLLAAVDLPQWRDDVPRLVRGTLGRQQRGHWNTTVANVWGHLAMRRFSAVFERAAVTGTTRLGYGATSRAVDWAKSGTTNETALPWQDGAGDVTVAHEGGGKPWLMVRATAALPLTRALSSGYRIERTLMPVEQATAGQWTRGDVARVRLSITAQTDMSWVVVDDPVPAGASLLGSGLGGQSQLLQRGEQRDGAAWLAFEERRFDAFRAYYRFVPKGTWTVEYTVRLNNPGTFVLPATRVEAMYAPEVFGEQPNARLTVAPR